MTIAIKGSVVEDEKIGGLGNDGFEIPIFERSVENRGCFNRWSPSLESTDF
jgi:hypothetical protein